MYTTSYRENNRNGLAMLSERQTVDCLKELLYGELCQSKRSVAKNPERPRRRHQRQHCGVAFSAVSHQVKEDHRIEA